MSKYWKIKIVWNVGHHAGKELFITGFNVIPKNDRYGKQFHTKKIVNRMFTNIQNAYADRVEKGMVPFELTILEYNEEPVQEYKTIVL